MFVFFVGRCQLDSWMERIVIISTEIGFVDQLTQFKRWDSPYSMTHELANDRKAMLNRFSADWWPLNESRYCVNCLCECDVASEQIHVLSLETLRQFVVNVYPNWTCVGITWFTSAFNNSQFHLESLMSHVHQFVQFREQFCSPFRFHNNWLYIKLQIH